MRQWVEKLAKAIEKEGVVVCNYMQLCGECIRVRHFECNIRYFETYNKGTIVKSTKHLEVVNPVDSTYLNIKLYDDEYDVLEKAFNYCKNNSQDNFIKQLENLE